MTRGSLSSGQRRLLQIIEQLNWGRIERLPVHQGQPHFDPAPRIVQEIKLATKFESPVRTQSDLTLKKEFTNLFDELNRLGKGIVDIEIQHSCPFRLTIDRDPGGVR